MSFYSPLSAGPDWGGGIQDLMSQFMMYQMLSKMYSGKDGKKKGEKETLRGMPKVGEMFLDQSPVDLPPQRELPQLPMGQMGQPPVGQQQPGIDMQQIMQMLQALGGIPGLTK